jgi:SAM-dependent methyltransferase
MFTAFGYFKDPAEDRRVVDNLYASLVPGGRLLIELLGREILARKFAPRDWHETGDVLILSDRKIEADWTWIHVREIFIRGTERWDTVMEHRLYAASDLIRLLRDAGFADTRAFGSLAGTPYDQNASRLVVVATK